MLYDKVTPLITQQFLDRPCGKDLEKSTSQKSNKATPARPGQALLLRRDHPRVDVDVGGVEAAKEKPHEWHDTMGIGMVALMLTNENSRDACGRLGFAMTKLTAGLNQQWRLKRGKSRIPTDGT